MDEEDASSSKSAAGSVVKPQKRRNVEKRREKSRTAARCRRSRESDIFTDLYDVVPLVHEPTVSHVDRIAVLRLAASLCKIRDLAPKVLETHSKEESAETDTVDASTMNLDRLWSEQSLSQCLDGFLIVADSEERILYISEGVAATLGLTQTDIIGQALEDLVHGEDLVEFREKIGKDRPSGSNEDEEKEENGGAKEAAKRIIMRIKSVLSPRGRNLNLKSATFKAVTFSVKVLKSAKGHVSDFVYILHGTPVYSTVQQQSQEGAQNGVFMTRHTSDMKFSYSHENITDYLGYDVKSLMGSSYYALVHPEDLQQLAATLKELFKKGQCRTQYYRLLAKCGGIVWVQTEATTLTHSTRGQRGQYVVCMHSVIGNFRSEECCSDVQLVGWNATGRKSRSPHHHPVRDCPSRGTTFLGQRRMAGAVAVGPGPEKKTKRQGTDENVSECAIVGDKSAGRTPRGGRGNDENVDYGRREEPHDTVTFDGPESIRQWLIGDYKPQQGDKTDPQEGGGKLFLSHPNGTQYGVTPAPVGDNQPSIHTTTTQNDSAFETPGSNGAGPADRLAALSISGDPGQGGGGQASPAASTPQPVSLQSGGWSYSSPATDTPSPSTPSTAHNTTTDPGGTQTIIYSSGGPATVGTSVSDSLAASNGGLIPTGGFGALFDAMFAPSPTAPDHNHNSQRMETLKPNSFDTWKNKSDSGSAGMSGASSPCPSTFVDAIDDLSQLCGPDGSEMLAPFVSADELFDLNAMTLPLSLDIDDCQINLDDFSDFNKADFCVPYGINEPVNIVVTNPMEDTSPNNLQPVSPSFYIKQEPGLYQTSSCGGSHPQVQRHGLATGAMQLSPIQASTNQNQREYAHPPDPGGDPHPMKKPAALPQRLCHFSPPQQTEQWQNHNPAPPIRVGRSDPQKGQYPISRRGYEAVMAYMQPHYAAQGFPTHPNMTPTYEAQMWGQAVGHWGHPPGERRQ